MICSECEQLFDAYLDGQLVHDVTPPRMKSLLAANWISQDRVPHHWWFCL